MKVDGNSLRIGNVIQHKGKMWRVVKTQHVKPGKGGAFLQCELSDVKGGTRVQVRFRASESVERVRLEDRTFQFLYKSGQGDGEYTFMDSENYEQRSLDVSRIGETESRFLTEGMEVVFGLSEGEIVTVSLPEIVACLVEEADAVVKGQTQSGSHKPAVLENGLRVMVPPYIERGAKIAVRLSDLSFVERVSS